jgi:hypothetical protein
MTHGGTLEEFTDDSLGCHAISFQDGPQLCGKVSGVKNKVIYFERFIHSSLKRITDTWTLNIKSAKFNAS